ncbi:MAG: NifB/NifX family molybdenum-iron cluster-binding protein [archaeon GB-1845-036]|nr:NifB/NifX family molybdenum-iron cluster-binding protein [Candidatus Culexmicrobium thermophilum]HDO20172.1 dinitrogenase iron-molybdenum cofactor [Candidatus Bathyarchaeota archaeon]
MVRIAFASNGEEGLKSKISHHFGRCPYYVFVDVEGEIVKNVEVKRNPFYNRHAPGIVPQFIRDEGADVIIAGGMGLRALEWFKRLNIKPITGVEGSVEEILKLYLRGELGEAAPCTEKSGEACH